MTLTLNLWEVFKQKNCVFQPDFLRTVNPFFSKLGRYVNLSKNRPAVAKGRKTMIKKKVFPISFHFSLWLTFGLLICTFNLSVTPDIFYGLNLKNFSGSDNPDFFQGGHFFWFVVWNPTFFPVATLKNRIVRTWNLFRFDTNLDFSNQISRCRLNGRLCNLI